MSPTTRSRARPAVQPPGAILRRALRRSRVGVAYVIARGIEDITTVLVIVGLALFIAIGSTRSSNSHRPRMSRGFAWRDRHVRVRPRPRGLRPCGRPAHLSRDLVPCEELPKYKADLASGKGWDGKLASKLHLTSYLKGKSKIKLPVAGGVFGAGKMLLSFGVATVAVTALTIYFFIALPGVKKLWLALIPRSRRERVSLLTEEVFDRVGGFMLGNLLTSLISGVGTYVWLLIFGVPYALLLGIFVALFDLIPMVGSTVAGIAVSLVALTKGLPVGIATAGFYVVYRFLEDYLLNPR